jgi:hypothetical protein
MSFVYSAIVIEGPSNVEIQSKRNPNDGKTKVYYWPKISGQYRIEIKFNNEQIQNSPFNVFIARPDDGGAIPIGPAPPIQYEEVAEGKSFLHV